MSRRSARQGGGWHGRPRGGHGAGGDRSGTGSTSGRQLIWGQHAATAALTNEARAIHRVWASEAGAERLQPLLAKRGLTATIATPRDLDRLAGADAVHQGLVLETEPLAEQHLDDLALANGAAGRPLLVVLDQVTDPHNVGAILRSAAAFGASGLVMTRHNSPPLGGALAKAASGALEHVPLSLVANLARALDDLADHDVWRIGLDGEGTATLESQRLDRPTALVLGAEGRGLRRLTREKCDVLVRIGTRGAIGSLNVSNAAAVALHWLTASAS